MSLVKQKKNKQKYTLQPKTKPLVAARANRFGRQLIQKIRSIQKRNPNAQLDTGVQVNGRKKAGKKEGVQNAAFDPFYENAPVKKHVLETIEENEDESRLKEEETPKPKRKKRKQKEEKDAVAVVVAENTETEKKKKKRKNDEVGFVNVGLDLEAGELEGSENNTMEVKREGGLENPAFEEQGFDLILNVTATPPPPVQTNRNQNGYTNRGFNPTNNTQQQRVNYARRTMENCGAEVENEINELKYPTVGETDDPEGENEKLEEGTKLKYKYARFSQRTPWYHFKATGPKKSYKHLIKGDIILAFKSTNLHEIEGYGVKRTPNQIDGENTKPKMKRVGTVATSLRRTAVVKPATFVTRSRTLPAEHTVRRTKQFVGYNTQQFVKPRMPRFQNRQYFPQNQQFYPQNQCQPQFNHQQPPNFVPNQQNFAPNQQFHQPMQPFPQFVQQPQNFGPQNQQFFPQNQFVQQFPQNQPQQGPFMPQNQQCVPQQYYNQPNFQSPNQQFSPMNRPRFLRPRRVGPNQFCSNSPNQFFPNNQQTFQGHGGYQNRQFYS